MTVSNFPPAFIFLAGAVLLAILPGRMRPAAYLVFPALALLLLFNMEEGARLTLPFLNYELILCRVDRLSLAFGYVFVIMGFLGGIYSFHEKEKLQKIASLLYVGSSLGVVFAGDLFTLLVFLEIMAPHQARWQSLQQVAV